MPSYLVLARKYRPTTFSEVVGQDHVIKTLVNSILSGRVAHAFLFCGVRGVGKTTVARILAKSLNCTSRGEGDANPCNQCTNCREIAGGTSLDVQEIDGASNTSVENIREINENIKYPPVSSPYKIIIIDEVHMISINAFNALLKTLEEPPPHAKFMFATTESHKVPATINSRCQRFNFRTIALREIVDGMARILVQEGIDADDEALALVAREAQGSFRDALSLLDQVIAFSPGTITAADVIGILGIAGRECFSRLMAAVLDRDPSGALAVVHELFEEGYDPEQFVMDLLHYVRNMVVVKTIPPADRGTGTIDALPSEIEQLEHLAGRTSPEHLQNLFAVLLRAEPEVKRSSNPWIALDMLALKMAHAPDVVDLAELLRRMDSGGSTPTRIAARPQAPSPRASAPAAKHAPRTSQAAAAPVAPAKAEREEAEEIPAESFTIMEVTPLPSESPDELWAILKERVGQSARDAALRSVMDHGKLISVGPTEVEIGFTKAFYRSEFENRLTSRSEVKRVFEEIFGKAKIKTLTLATETPLDTEKPYAPPPDGQTDLDRALRHEAQDNPVTKAVLAEFEDSSIEFIKILAPKS
ncbi:MAG: DNA polymerase III subunit gamma/tau [Desulfomonile tiedjei]|nr:DNA polymerase III subunit gamma/tau [Desulfomonile tiedjei]